MEQHSERTRRLFASLCQAVEWQKDPDTGRDVVSIPDVCGDFWWAQLHSWAENIRDVGCPSCGEFAVRAAEGLHDIVNSHLGKPLQHPESVLTLASAVLDTLEANPQFNNGAVAQHQDEDLCELVPRNMTFEATLIHQDPASLE